jgi:chromatin remodeling complex protein RSC6
MRPARPQHGGAKAECGLKREIGGTAIKTEVKCERRLKAEVKCENRVKVEAQPSVTLERRAAPSAKVEPSRLPPLETKVEQLRAVKAELLAAKREPGSGAVSSLLQRGLAIRKEQAKKSTKAKGEWGQKAKVKKERSRRADGRPRKKQKVTAKRRNASRRAMERELPLSPELAELLGSDALSRPEAVRRLWSHCKEKGMLNPVNKREVRFDPCLQKMLGQKTAMLPQLISLLSPHFDYSSVDVKAEAKHERGAKREAKAELKREAKAELKKQELKEELKEELKAEMGSRERQASSAATRYSWTLPGSGDKAGRAVKSLKAEDAGADLLEDAAREVVEEALSRSATELLSFDDSSATVRCQAPPGSFALEAVASPPLAGGPRASCSAAAAACRLEFREAADGALAGYAEATLRGLEPSKAYSISVRVAGASPSGGPGRGSQPAALPQREAPERWNEHEVQAWCAVQRCPELPRAAREYAINGKTLMSLGEDDLKALGITAPFLLRRVLEGIAVLRRRGGG